MKLTTKSEYSILALIYLARQSQKRKEFVKIEEICVAYDISKKYLEQLFFILKQNRYLKTRRGSAGGYALAKEVDKISLAEIIRLMDGALAPTESVSQYFFAPTPLEKEIRDYISNRLEKLTLVDLI